MLKNNINEGKNKYMEHCKNCVTFPYTFMYWNQYHYQAGIFATEPNQNVVIV